MIAIDTNILVYAHVPGLAQHGLALRALEALANSGAQWAVPWPCAHEFCAVITNRKWRSDAVDAEAAVAILRSWEGAPNFRFLGATHLHLNCFAQTLTLSGASGGHVHDARIAATCIEHNVTELWTADRDFSRFPGLRTRNPLVGDTTGVP
jgi:toxin-antitoxin system PIN domain toxin